MKIGLFSDSYFPVMDGVSVAVHNYHTLLLQHGIESTLIVPESGGGEVTTPQLVRFPTMPIPGLHPYRFGHSILDLTLASRLVNRSFQLVHSHSPFYSGKLALRVSRRLKKPLVSTFHSKYKEDLKRYMQSEALLGLAMSQIMRYYEKADFVWVPNHATGKTIREYGYGGEYEVVPNGTDFELLTPYEKEMIRRETRSEYGLGDGDFLLLFVGQLRWEKNIETVIKALKLMHQMKKPFRMFFVGEGSDAAEIEEMVRLSGLEGPVSFLGAQRDRKVIQKLFAMSDVFVFPSVYDNAPLVVREAAACLLPSVLVRNTSAAEGIFSGKNGFLIDNSPLALCHMLCELMENRKLIDTAGKGAGETIYRSWSSIIDDVVDIYEYLIRGYHIIHPGIVV